MNVLVTGANGFIGQALCKRLMADGYHVRGVVRGAGKDRGQRSDVGGRGKTDVGGQPSTQSYAVPRRVEVGDIGPETDWGEALDGIDTVVHLAARVHVMRESAADPLAVFRQVNVVGTERLARQAVAAGVKRFVFVSSVKVNGEGTGERDERPTSNIERPTSNEKDEELATDPHRLAQTFVRATCSGKNSHRFAKEKAEGRYEPYTEMDKPDPQDAYAVSKWEAEQGLLAIAEETGA